MMSPREWSLRGRHGWDRGVRLVDAGKVVLALPSATSSELIVYAPTDKKYDELGRIKFADSQPYTFPIVSGKRIFIKDQDKLTLWMLD